jgi:hypothetical chaperone protein
MMSTPVGIDFGTSNCAAAVVRNGVPVPIQLGQNQLLLPSVLYVDRAELKPVEIDEAQLSARVDAARAAQTRVVDGARRERRAFVFLSDSELERRERSLMVREALQTLQAAESAKDLVENLLGARSMAIGDSAIQQRLQNSLEGTYFKSPKRFLGSDLRPAQRQIFQRVIATMLSHIRERCQFSLGSPLTSAVFGRPVTYSEFGDPAADALAIGTMTSAAIEAGFKDISFLMEPVAAALEYERTLTTETTALVIDAGGGTTDCSVVRLGPGRAAIADRAADVLSSSGSRVGGVDIDESLAWCAIVPLLGKDGKSIGGRPLPYTLFHKAISVHNLPEQAEFYASERQILGLMERAESPQIVERLLHVCRRRLTDRIVRGAELAKIELSEQERCSIALEYVETELSHSVTRADLEAAAQLPVQKMLAAAEEAVKLSGARPDVVFVTGGTARSPVIEQAIHARWGASASIVVGDLFGSVASGLAIHAAWKYA